MAWKQVLTPNLDTDPKHPLYVYQGGKILTDWYGWCLAVVHASYGAKGSSYSAKTAWQACNTKHKDYNLPEGVWTPVWWEGGQYGHVAIAYKSGDNITVYSSPYVHQPYFQVFKGSVKSTLDSMGRTYGVGSFSGWTESVLDSRVISYQDDKPKPTKSNEEICKEVWEGKWGTGKEREKRLTEAGYDYATIQKMVDAGVGKPTNNEGDDMKDDTKPEEPKDNGSKEPTTGDDSSAPQPNDPNTPSSGNSQPDSETNSDETPDTKDEFVPAQSQDAQFIGGIIEEAGDGFIFPDWLKLTAYFIGDALLVGALLIPDINNALNAPTSNVWAEYMSKVLLEAGISVLTIFKLFKRKGK